MEVFTKCKYYGILSLVKCRITSDEKEWTVIAKYLNIFGYSKFFITKIELVSKLKPLINLYLHIKVYLKSEN